MAGRAGELEYLLKVKGRHLKSSGIVYQLEADNAFSLCTDITDVNRMLTTDAGVQSQTKISSTKKYSLQK